MVFCCATAGIEGSEGAKTTASAVSQGLPHSGHEGPPAGTCDPQSRQMVCVTGLDAPHFGHFSAREEIDAPQLRHGASRALRLLGKYAGAESYRLTCRS